MNTEADLARLARRALALDEQPISESENEYVRLLAQRSVLRALARALADRVVKPGPGKGGVVG